MVTLKSGLIVIGCIYVFGTLAFAVFLAVGYWDTGWSIDRAVTTAFQRALLWPLKLARELT